jgi:hypothetical protein
LVHALLLFGPGELRALRVGDADLFRIIRPMLDVHPTTRRRATTSQLAQALNAVCVVEQATFGWWLPNRSYELGPA